MSSYARSGNSRDAGGEMPRDFTTYATLLGKAHEETLTRVKTDLIQTPDDGNHQTAIVKAEVETARGVFVALGDASPDNVEAFLAPHLIRVAETRAKARALRDAVNIGVVSLEELDGRDFSAENSHPRSGAGLGNGSTARQNIRRFPEDRRGVTEPRRGPSDPSAAMTEPQRRYLFRLLAAQGVTGEAAQEEIRTRLGVEHLREAKKSNAGALIDALLKEQGESDAPSR